MAILKKQGTFQTPASNGTLAITGVGFEPKLVIFHLHHAGDKGLDARVMLGAATSAGQWVEAGFSGDGDTPSDDRRYARLTECIGTLQSSSIQCRAALQTMDTNGFTLNFVSTAAVENITYQAFGGADLDVAVGNVTQPNTSINFSVSGLSFEPKAIQLATCYLPSGSGQSGNFYCNLGAATAADQFSVYAGADDNEDPSDTFRYHSNTSMLKRVSSGGATPDVEVGFASFETDGFTLNATTPVGTAQPLPYIAWGGNIDVNITQVTAKNANGLQEVRGLGFEPDFTYAYSIQAGGNVDKTTAIGNAAFSLGYSDGTDEFVSALRALDNKSPSEAFYDSVDAFMYTGVDQSTAWNTATYTPDADGFDLNWTDTDGLTREIFTISFVGLGGGAIDISAAFSVRAPTFSIGATNLAPGNSASINYTIPAPIFSATSTITAPVFTSIIAFDVNAPTFSATSTIVNPAGATIAFDIDVPTFSASAAQTVPIFTSTIAYSISAPTFSASASPALPGTVSNVNFSIDSPIFSATASIIIPDVDSSVAFDINAPTFSVIAGTDADVYYYGNGTQITLKTDSRLISASNLSRIVRV